MSNLKFLEFKSPLSSHSQLKLYSAVLFSLRGLAIFTGTSFRGHINSKYNFKMQKFLQSNLSPQLLSYKNNILTKFKCVKLECNQITDQLLKFKS